MSGREWLLCRASERSLVRGVLSLCKSAVAVSRRCRQGRTVRRSACVRASGVVGLSSGRWTLRRETPSSLLVYHKLFFFFFFQFGSVTLPPPFFFIYFQSDSSGGTVSTVSRTVQPKCGFSVLLSVHRFAPTSFSRPYRLLVFLALRSHYGRRLSKAGAP